VWPTSALVVHVGCRDCLLEEPEEYAPLLPNSPEGPSPEGAVNNDVSSEIGSSTPLVESSLPVNLLLNVIQDPIFL
jgi:hypothetical protein